jgi:hypothetical protein
MPKNIPPIEEDNNLQDNNPFSIENIKQMAYRYFVLNKTIHFINEIVKWEKLDGTECLDEINKIENSLELLHKRIIAYYVEKILQKRLIRSQPIKLFYPFYDTNLSTILDKSLIAHKAIYNYENILISAYYKVICNDCNNLSNSFLYQFLIMAGGYALFSNNSTKLRELVGAITLKNFQEPIAKGVVLEFLGILPHHSQEDRMDAAIKLMNTNFCRPIYNKRWNYLKEDIDRELHRRAKIHGTSPKELIELSILIGIFSLPKATLPKAIYKKLKVITLEELSLNELSKNPSILKQIMAQLTTEDLAPPGWRRKHLDLPLPEESEYPDDRRGGWGELELAGTILEKKWSSDWHFDEINEQNKGVAIATKLESLNLTPRERAIIETRLAGAEPIGTPGAIKTVLSRLRKKMREK